ncbi:MULTISPECIES: acyl-CoA carboxylase epsilon subunit [unclassified Streptomyces]|uniref:acyl-CoA carboxylase epsilon subunit n=1 Tax=Streptomyces sp. SID10362 TaxID=2706021 RepID=UPI0013CAB143|nr:acyl-CoA carboxylase subunit epsilon [Streptomyces sp. SID10362]
MPNDSSLFRLAKGAPTDSELAALTAVLVALAGDPAEAPAPVTPQPAWRRRPYQPPASWRRAA